MISDRSWLISAWKANVSVSSAMVVGGGSNGCPGAALRKSGEEEPQVENKSVSHDEHRRREASGRRFFLSAGGARAGLAGYGHRRRNSGFFLKRGARAARVSLFSSLPSASVRLPSEVGRDLQGAQRSTGAMAAGGVIVYEDIFEILDQDADGKRFDRVSRFRCRSAFESDLQIDINVDIYKLEVCLLVDDPPRSAAAPPRGAHRRRNRQLRPSRSHPLESFSPSSSPRPADRHEVHAGVGADAVVGRDPRRTPRTTRAARRASRIRTSTSCTGRFSRNKTRTRAGFADRR